MSKDTPASIFTDEQMAEMTLSQPTEAEETVKKKTTTRKRAATSTRTKSAKSTTTRKSKKETEGIDKKNCEKISISSDIVKGRDTIPLTEETWLKQPIAMTMMRQDYSSVQNKILVSVVEHLQTAISDLINFGRPVHELKIFDHDKDCIELDIPLKDFGITKNHYPELKLALHNLVGITVEIPYKDAQSQKEYVKVTNLCDAYIPKERYANHVIIQIHGDVAQKILTVRKGEMGYHLLGKEIVINCNNKYTQRIYMLISSWKRLGQYTLNTITLRKLLKCETKYVPFRHFARKVLDAAQKELKELYDRQSSDCYFEYERIYKGRKKTGEPDQLHFTIISQAEDKTTFIALRSALSEMLDRHTKLTAANKKFILSNMTAYNCKAYHERMYNILIASRESTVKSPSAYIMKSVENYLEELKQKHTDGDDAFDDAEEVTDSHKASHDASASELNTDTQASEDVDNEASDERTEEARIDSTDEEMEVFPPKN